MKVFSNGRIVEYSDLQAIESIIELRKRYGFWECLDELVKFWVKRYPKECASISKAVEEYRATLKDPKYGQTSQGKDFERRFILSFPQRLYLLIKVLYKEKVELDRQFFKKFAKRYRFLRVADKPE